MAIVSSHTLNGVDGTHACGIAVTLSRLDDDGSVQIFATKMDDGGRLSEEVDLSGADPLVIYEMVFKTADYWQARGITGDGTNIVAEIVLRFQMSNLNATYHMPIIFSPHSYSCWKSS